MKMDPDKINFIKLVELLAGSTVLISALAYFCGYVMLNTFLQNKLNINSLTGPFLPTSTFIALGFILILSLLIVLPYIYLTQIGLTSSKFFNDAGFMIVFIIASLITLPLFRLLPDSRKIHGLSLALVIALTVGIISGLLALSILIWRFVKKTYTSNHKRLSRFMVAIEETLRDYCVAIPLIIPSILTISHNSFESLSGEVTKVNDLSIYFVYKSFIPELGTIITILIILLKGLGMLPNNSRLNIIRIMVFVGALITSLYSFSSIIGKSLSDSYKFDGKGVFPIVYVKTSIAINALKEEKGSNGDYSNTYNLLSEDTDTYYFFQNNDKRLFVVPKGKIIYLTINH